MFFFIVITMDKGNFDQKIITQLICVILVNFPYVNWNILYVITAVTIEIQILIIYFELPEQIT